MCPKCQMFLSVLLLLSSAENSRLYLFSWVSSASKQQACWHLTTGHQGSTSLSVFKYSVAWSKSWCCQKWNMDVHILQLSVIMGCFTWNEKQSRVSRVRISPAFLLCFTASCLCLWVIQSLWAPTAVYSNHKTLKWIYGNNQQVWTLDFIKHRFRWGILDFFF